MLKKACLLIVFLIASAAISGYFTLRASLPKLEGQQALPGLSQPVQIHRDKLGVALLSAKSRLDLARATGFLHAQERFFQMDLLRRNAAGELSALFGKAAIKRDKKIRLHQFRKRAESFIPQYSPQHQQLLLAYTQGVNNGLQGLSAKPFEYWLLNETPQPWQPADTILTLYSMYLDLQQYDGRRDISIDLMRQHLPQDLAQFLDPAGSQWDAPIDNTTRPTSPIPDNVWPLTKEHVAKASVNMQPADLLPGSNNWAVSGELTSYGGAMLANDMHLGIRVPNTWFRASFEWQQDGETHRVHGLSLPGTPNLIVGSNEHLAWGFTNSYGDWSDVIRLKLDANKEKYLTPHGYRSFHSENETIAVSGGNDETLTIKLTQWGPVIGQDQQGNLLVYRWVAHDLQGANLNIIGMETAHSVQQGMQVAATSGMPAQNMMLADKQGQIGWTISGPIPNRQGFDGRQLSDWSDGSQNWLGYLAGPNYPKVLNPEQHRLWTANSRVVGGEMYRKIGDGGYALGARSRQIRDNLYAKQHFSEQDLLNIQLDDKAIFLTPWRQLLLEQVLPTTEFEHKQGAVEAIQNWSGHASTDDLGYLLVRQFRLKTRKLVFTQLNNYLSQQHQAFNFRSISNQLEAPLWQLVSQQPAHLLPKGYHSWQQLLTSALTQTLQQLNNQYVDWRKLSWGEFNHVEVQHPMSSVVPMLDKLANMQAQPQAGDTYMPRISGKTRRGAFGSSQRLVVAPGQEKNAILHMPSSQSGHPLSPYFGAGHQDWAQGNPTPLLPGNSKYQLQLMPEEY